jgi:predicted RNase H-like HicB family nuclease
MSDDVASILASVPNSGIVQMPGRTFPGIVLQGDSLSKMFDDLVGALQQARERQDEDTFYALLNCAERIQELLSAYEEALEQRQLERPYLVSIKKRLVADDFAA